jgi:16S rRNA (cytosine1402-N4)-methyltransferase
MIALAPHIPVLLDEVIHALAITPGSEIVDGTFGAGGYSQAILAGGARVYAFDRDPDALSEGADLAGRSEGALRLYSACFSDLDDVLHRRWRNRSRWCCPRHRCVIHAA